MDLITLHLPPIPKINPDAPMCMWHDPILAHQSNLCQQTQETSALLFLALGIVLCAWWFAWGIISNSER